MKHLRKNPTLNLKLILDIRDMPIFETTMQNTRSKKTKTIFEIKKRRNNEPGRITLE